ncbi:hypothetical protein CDD80_484 [Ophiocordyceps camponoti-rufipedis]|uniref:Extracellular membrane protein CFEM domain-containing protein n=1 Tax=Ophiocordyceps camponoti-rufipedis TaxID=2004952 RepID=A0A2C5ZCU7_9HYPO|nr:hypothetical protein CDD80_484 [Ophiocordyceps camponoti-rufipedis]
MTNNLCTGLMVLVSTVSALSSPWEDACFGDMKHIFRDNIKEACYGFAKGNMTEVGLEKLCRIEGGRFNLDKCSATMSILSTNCGTKLQAITRSCQLRYPELKHPYCVEDACYQQMTDHFQGSIEKACDEMLDDSTVLRRYAQSLNGGCGRSMATVKSVCNCVRPAETTMIYDEKRCLEGMQSQFGAGTGVMCHRLMTETTFWENYKIFLFDICGQDMNIIRSACKWDNKLLGFNKCLEKSCYRGLAQTYDHTQISDVCSAVIDRSFTQGQLKAVPQLARQCGGSLEELRSACFCVYPAERYPHCGADDCFRGIASDWGEDIEANCRTVLTRNFTDSSEPECKNELEGLVQESKWLGLQTHAFDQCGKDQAKLEKACRCVLPDVEEGPQRCEDHELYTEAETDGFSSAAVQLEEEILDEDFEGEMEVGDDDCSDGFYG